MEKSGSAGLNTRQKKREGSFLLVGVILPLFFLINDLVGWINGGGIFSIISAVNAARDGVPVISVDEAGLRTTFLAALSVPLMAISRLVELDFNRKYQEVLGISWLIGGAFVLNAMYGEAIISGYMTDRDYYHCEPMDYEAGSGKSTVRFDTYVSADQVCEAE